MSLLMDALKKAELAQRKVQQASVSTPVIDSASSTASISLTSPPDATTSVSARESIQATAPTNIGGTSNTMRIADQDERWPSPVDHPSLVNIEAAPKASSSSALSLEDIETPAASVFRASENTQEKESAQQRESIQNLFETKQTAQTGPSRKTFGIAVGVITILALLAIGLYFWLQLQPKSGLQPAASLKTFPQSSVVSNSPTPTTTALTDSGSAESLPEAQPVEHQAETEPRREAFASGNRFSSAPPTKKVFQVTTAAPLSNSTLDRAYDALTRGDDAASKTAYEKALAADPKNIDALSGLAVIAQRAGNPSKAADYYLQILDADPKNPVALGGLINLQSRMDPAEAETRVKQALSAQPDSPALNFSLGNVYARSKRWGDAQQSYFKATTADPSNPDYLFNLAVSLEQLRQPKLAATYYAQAIAAADSRPGSFDKAKAAERLQQLQQ